MIDTSIEGQLFRLIKRVAELEARIKKLEDKPVDAISPGSRIIVGGPR